MAVPRQVFRGLAFAWLAVVALSLFSGPLYMLVTWIIYVKIDHFPSYGGWDWSILGLLFMVGLAAVMLAAPIAACVSIGIGLPVFGFMFKAGVRSPLGYGLAGFLVSLVPAVLLTLAYYYAAFLVHEDFIFALSLIGIAGPISGVVFWWGAFKGRGAREAVVI